MDSLGAKQVWKCDACGGDLLGVFLSEGIKYYHHWCSPEQKERDRVAQAKGAIITAADDLVALWKAQRVSGATRAERNAAIDQARANLVKAVDELTRHSPSGKETK